MNRTQEKKDLITSQFEELRTLRDEIRLDLHLAGMELKDEWQKIERELPVWTQTAEELRDAAGEGLDLLAGRLRKFQVRLRDKGASRPGWPG